MVVLVSLFEPSSAVENFSVFLFLRCIFMQIIDTSLQKESQDRYLTYALSVVSSRALPDVRDGLKPVQRRILFDMFKHLHLTPDSSHRKSAAVVGGVLARFHPHGDTACYEAMVRMAQDFSLRYPLVDGQGNFGSLDGDGPAAYRYTEVKLRALALEVIGEIDESTVQYRDNFDGTQIEPVVLPSRVPNLLMNGAVGIAVGMATSIPPHNLRDIVKSLVALIEDPEISIAKLVTTLKAPDFPTGCAILNSKKELEELYTSGRGQIKMRGDWNVEEQSRGKRSIIITSIPYALDKSQLVEKIANLIIDKKVPQLVDIRDESTSDVRIVLELAAEADADVAMAYLLKNTPLESNFSVNLTALAPSGEGGALRPELLNIKQILQHFIEFRHDIVVKRLLFEKLKLEERIHILEGLICIYDALDQVIKIIRQSEGRSDAATRLRGKFKLSEIQSFAVVDMRLYQLSKTSIAEIRAELKDKETRVAEIKKLLASKKAITKIVQKELEEISSKYGDARKSKIVKDGGEIEFDESLYVVQEEVFAIVTKDGWLKRIRQNNELSSTRLREGDEILSAHPLSTLDSVAFFTNLGSIYILKVNAFPSSSGYGEPIQKLLKFKDGERVIDSWIVMGQSSDGKDSAKQKELFSSESQAQAGLREGDNLVLVSKGGLGFSYTVSGLSNLTRAGKRIMKLKDGDELRSVQPLKGKVALFTKSAYGLVVTTKEIPIRSSSALGVIVIGVRDDDEVVNALTFDRKAKFSLQTDTGSVKEISSESMVSGRRALKGNKVIARGEIKQVKLA